LPQVDRHLLGDTEERIDYVRSNVKRFLAAVDEALGTREEVRSHRQDEPGFRRRPGSLRTAADRRGAA